MFDKLRRVKMLYNIYNFFNYHKLKYQLPLYRDLGLKKNFYSSIYSRDFPKNNLFNNPWLDHLDSVTVLPQDPKYLALDPAIKSEILNWSAHGYAILRGFYSPEKVIWINDMLDKLIQKKVLSVKDKRKFMFAVKYSEELKNTVSPMHLVNILEILMGKELELYQSVNFLQGSEEPAHSDFIHMSTYPYGNLIAVWIALEDINEENGALFYYPGSHKLDYVMKGDFAHGGDQCFLGKNTKQKYLEKIAEKIQENAFEKKVFCASKGDVIIWHANLLHGGGILIDPNRTRKSMVLHYYAKDVIRYHEITERPALQY